MMNSVATVKHFRYFQSRPLDFVQDSTDPNGQMEDTMPERLNTLVPRGGPQNLRAGEQVLRFMVWPKGEPARVVMTKSKETGKDIATPIPRLPLFRWRATIADIDGGKLSAFWESVRFASWPHWEPVVDIRAAKDDPDAPPTMMAMRKVTGQIDEKKGAVGTSRQSIMWSDLAYKTDDYRGSFSYDKEKGLTLPLNEGNVHALIQALRNQVDNPDTVGRRGDDVPRRLWSPFSVSDNPKDAKEIGIYEANLDIFKSWVGKLVFWEFEEVDTTAVLR